jgi:2-keto-4-pentenoate hydratase/2-oxohepta-3-ene-1,7-dioic acid hydratase in catechol pathway
LDGETLHLVPRNLEEDDFLPLGRFLLYFAGLDAGASVRCARSARLKAAVAGCYLPPWNSPIFNLLAFDPASGTVRIRGRDFRLNVHNLGWVGAFGMRLIRCGSVGQERPGVLLGDGTRVDATGFGSDYDEAFFGGDGLERLRQWVARDGQAAPRFASSVRLGPPIRRPSKIICIGLNFRDHATETHAEIPKEPVIFFKATTAMVGPNDPVMIPKNATKVDWEVELAVVIGKKASYVPREQALQHVAGYVLHNDYSERSFQLERGGQWVKGKSADTFAPLGPFLATPDELPDVNSLGLWLKVNGQVRQKSSTSNLIFDVATLVAYVSEFMTLLPGDVISTGTPAGVGLGMKPPTYLKAGDVVELGIDGLGESSQTVINYA